MLKNFTLSYDVKPSSDYYTDEANTFRNSLEDLLKFNQKHIKNIAKNKYVRTTITGKILLLSTSQTSKKIRAKRLVCKYISEAAKEMYIKLDNIEVNFLMEVDGTNEAFEFQLRL